MKPRRRSPFTSGEGSIVIEIKCQAAPMGPDVPQPQRIRLPRRRHERDQNPLHSSVDPKLAQPGKPE
jgi:hypothetical protein